LVEKVYAIIPTMPSRRGVLLQAVSSLVDQVDKVIIYTTDTGTSALPFPCKEKIEIHLDGVDRGSANRFKAGGLKGYLAYCDDDLEYAPNYIYKLMDGVEKYGRKCVVGFHGRVLNPPLISFCGVGPGRMRACYPCLESVPMDAEVHMIGTGVMMYHSDTIQITELDLMHDNLDDAEFSIICQNRGIPLVVLAHYEIVKYLHPEGRTIFGDTMQNQRPLLDVINSHSWRLYGAAR